MAASFDREVTAGANGSVHIPTGRRVAAVLPVHTPGHPADLDPLVALADRHGIPVVADAAAALGASYRDRPIGRTGAAISVFSFHGNETVTAGGGGALASDDDRLLARACHLSTTARAGADYDHDEVGFNYRMTNLQAAVDCAQLEQLDTFLAVKRRIQAVYTERFADLTDLVPLPEAPWAHSARWFAGWNADRVAALRAGLREDGIDARPFWKPMHLQRPYADSPAEPLPVTMDLWPRVVTLPCSRGITDDELATVVAVVRARVAG